MAGGDGNGWVRCRCGHRHWGRHGAAGLLLVRGGPGASRSRGAGAASGPEVLLQLRAGWTHLGGTWGLPGGAADSHESAAEAALREAHEEVGVPADRLRLLGEVVGTDHVDWRYTVVLAEPVAPVHARAANDESDEVRWVHPDQVGDLPLHPGLAAGWPALAGALASARGEGRR